MIRAENLVVRRGQRTILQDLSLHAEAGHVTAIVGANGAGKSTLMRTLAGDLKPTSGEVYLGKTRISERESKHLATKRAVVSQATSLRFGFRVKDVVELGRIPHQAVRGSATSESKIISECLETAGVAHLGNRLFPSLSGGEKQRVQLARALAQIWSTPNHERVLLLDEPTSALDLRHQQSTLALARQLADDGCTVVVVLHDLNLAARYADICALLHDGDILAEGSPADVFTPEHLARAFQVHTTILEHPEFGCPLVVTLDPTKANDLCTPQN